MSHLSIPSLPQISAIPLASKVIAALSLALLPLGILALVAASHSYAQLAALHSRVGVVQALGIALPALMWLVALAIASVSLNRLVIEPLRSMRLAMERYAAGDLNARMVDGTLSSPELAELRLAFNTMADRVAGHAKTTADALVKQKALTREVHHRVKNNLQIVSSLLSLQARDAASSDVTAAYALIRQRVNALALVHRWMYQDEGAHGVEMQSLICDLCANLEHGSDGFGGGRRITCAAERLSVSQDTALPIAFLITELLGSASLEHDAEPANARVDAYAIGAKGRVTVASNEFVGEDGLTGFQEGSRRIVSGLARQLRSSLRYDPAAHAFSIEFSALVCRD